MSSEFKQLLDFQTYHYFPIPKKIKSVYSQLKDVSYIHFAVDDTYDWKDAKRYAKKLSLGGFNDWRLPHHEIKKSLSDSEAYGLCLSLETLIKYMRIEYDADIHKAIRYIYDDIDSYYDFWTDKESLENTTEAYCMSYNDSFNVYCCHVVKSAHLINICVR